MPWTSPFHRPGQWFKGNLHTHTTQSDGMRTPEEVLAWYRSRGYDFIALSDHWFLSRGCACDEGFITLGAAEVQGSNYHLLTLGLRELPPRAWAEDPQRIISELKVQGALCYIAHPYWTGRPSSELMPLVGLDGIEVYNAVCEASKGTGHGRVHWDDCLSAGRRLTGLAVDDSHWHHAWEGVGYVMVRAKCLTESALLAALQAGAFYSSAGPVIEDLAVSVQADGATRLTVSCSACAEILFYTAGPRGQRVVAEPGRSLTHAMLPLHAEQRFVRVECRDANGGIAWTNPVYLADILSP